MRFPIVPTEGYGEISFVPSLSRRSDEGITLASRIAWLKVMTRVFPFLASHPAFHTEEEVAFTGFSCNRKRCGKEVAPGGGSFRLYVLKGPSWEAVIRGHFCSKRCVRTAKRRYS